MKIIIILMMLIMTERAAFAQTKAEDKGNDIRYPEDPQCPCYEVQKQAEKEYMEILRKEQSLVPVLIKNSKAEVNNRKEFSKRREDKKRKRKKYRGKTDCPEL